MKINRITTLFKYLKFLHMNHNYLEQEFLKNEEFKGLIHKQKITTLFQPIVSLKENVTLGVEILNRPEPTYYLPTTDKFYDYAGQSHMVFIVEAFLRELSLETY